VEGFYFFKRREKMKKTILFLTLFLMFQMGNKISFLVAEDGDAVEVKKVIEGFLRNCNNNVDSAMELVSANYSERRGDNTVDRAQFRRWLENLMDWFHKKYVDMSLIDLQFNNVSTQGNMANVEFEYSGKAFNLDTLQDEITKYRRSVTLVKENGYWKIKEWRILK